MKREPTRIYLACGATDMRRQINGLSAMVQETFNQDPFGEMMFVFCNRQRNRIKCLWWDQNGFWLYFKRLDRGRFRWPADDEAGMKFSPEELEQLLSGPNLEQKIKRNEFKSPKLF